MKRIVQMLAALLLCLTALAHSESACGFSVHFIDVGQGDAAIVLCDGKSLMIDGGSIHSSSKIYSYITNTLGLTHIDYMIASHIHDDHIGGLSAALNACDVGVIYSPVESFDSDSFKSLTRYASASNTLISVPSFGYCFDLGAARVQFISASNDYSDDNDMSIVTKITYMDTSFLFTGDASMLVEKDLLNTHTDIKSTLLKVSHHGSSDSSSDAFIQAVDPEYAVISVGKNAYGHPSDAVIDRLCKSGATIYRTDYNGTIVCYSDGNTVTIHPERTNAQRDATAVTLDDADYIYNKNTKKFHIPSCQSVYDMKDRNKGYFSGNKDELIREGYIPCKLCNP